MTNNFVALVNCFYCGEPSGVAVDKHLQDISKIHNKVVDMIPCAQCAQYMKKGIILIGIDSSKSDESWNTSKFPNPYRTGQFVVIKDSALEKSIPEEIYKDAYGTRFLFMESEAFDMLGITKLVKEKL